MLLGAVCPQVVVSPLGRVGLSYLGSIHRSAHPSVPSDPPVKEDRHASPHHDTHRIYRSTSLLMLGLAVTILTPLTSSLSSLSAIAGLQAGLLLLVIAAAGMDTLESAQSERRLRKSLAGYKQALEDLKQIEEQQRELLAQDYMLQIQQLLEGLVPPRAQEPGEKIWIVPEQEAFSVVPQRPELPMAPARPGYRWPRAS
jgi:hypothetical protein